MDVAGEDDGVGDAAVGPESGEGHALVGGTRPLVHGVDGLGVLGSAREGDQSHHDLLGEHVPVGLRGDEAAVHPVALFGSEQGVARVEGGGVEGLVVVAVGLVGAVLAGVEHEELSEPSEAGLAVELEVGPLW